MSQHFPKVRVATTQLAPVFLDRDATIDKVIRFIDEAGAAGAQVIAFPEAIVPGYPIWMMTGAGIAEWTPFQVRLYKEAVEIPSLSTQKLSEAARRNRMYVCISVTEKDAGSLYLTQLWFDPHGDLIGKHRKLKPTLAERTVWGEGDGSMMPVFETEIGNLGGLQCWEHWLPLNLEAMASKNEQIHVASWPALLDTDMHGFGFGPCEVSTKYYAQATQTFVLMSCSLYSQEIDDMVVGDNPNYRSPLAVGAGGTSEILSPIGNVLARVPFGEEGIAYADIDLEDIITCKWYIDPAGHYSIPSVLSMNFNEGSQPPVRKYQEREQEVITYEELQSDR